MKFLRPTNFRWGQISDILPKKRQPGNFARNSGVLVA